MKYSLNQIKKYVPEVSSIPVPELISRIWTSVAEVESVEDLSKKFEGIVVGKILSVEDHPKSEKLIIANVDIGKTEPVTVVTAAHNISKGDFVPYIPVGGIVPSIKSENGDQIEIGIRTMAGIPSVGMLASEKELGLSDNHEGIMILLPEELKHELVAGESLSVALELDDVIFEIENKSLTHRGDCFSIVGIAREIAALYGFELIIPEWQKASLSIPNLLGPEFDKVMPCALKVVVSATQAVERYSAIVLDGVQVRKSPQWLQHYLSKLGVSSVNNVVDITNYVMLEYGQPMHAFDASTLVHKKREDRIEYTIDVRYAKAGEKIVTLDNKEKILPAIAPLITDSEKPLGIAGIIGGKESGITENSTRIILEAAVFNKYAIRNTSMSLGITTDASVVFSRKQDPEKTARALLRAVHLLQELCGAEVVSSIADEYLPQKLGSSLVVSHEKMEQFIGIALSPVRVVAILKALGCEVVKKNGMYRIDTPSWRPDIAIDEDVYEEIARIVGYKEIVPELPKRGIFGIPLSHYEQIKQASFETLSSIGIVQAMNFSFVSKALYDRCQMPIADARSIVNAISPDVQYMRKQIAPGLIEQLAKNQYNTNRFALFELGKISRKGLSYSGEDVSTYHMPEARFGIDELGLPIEDEHIAIGIIDDSTQPGFFTLKHLIEQYMQHLHVEIRTAHISDLPKKISNNIPSWAKELLVAFRSGRSALILEKGTNVFIGVIGEPATMVRKSFGLTKQVAIAEFSLNRIAQYASLEPQYREPSKFPLVTEDYCFEFPIDVQYENVMLAYEKVNVELQGETSVKQVPIDIYQKREGFKQVTHRLIFTPKNGSLADTQLRLYRAKYIAEMAKLGGKII